jgi:RNase P subunit RPR2
MRRPGLQDITGVISLALWESADTGAELLFGAVQNSLHKLTGSRSLFPALRWDCPGCGQQVTDRAPAGRPVHGEHGHAPGCARLAVDQATEDEKRRKRLARLIVHSEDPAGSVQRHWLIERIEDDCPRCGWHGYFHHYLATIDGDWRAAVCDDCYADLHPAITVTVRTSRLGRLSMGARRNNPPA